MPCLKDEYAREKAENARNDVRDKGEKGETYGEAYGNGGALRAFPR